MTEVKHHATVDIRSPLTGERHEISVWAVIDPGEPGKCNGHPDDRYPEDPARVVEWACIHVDGWPLESKTGRLSWWVERHKPEIEGAFVTDWKLSEHYCQAEVLPPDADDRLDERLTWAYHHAAG